MTHFTALHQLDLSAIDTLVFAGGGNRCWWQGGIMQFCGDKGWLFPQTLIGTSAGAAIAASSLTLGPEHALNACQQLYSSNERLFHWKTEQGRWLQFAHQHIYPAWIASFVNETTRPQLLEASSRLLVAVTQPSRWLGLLGSVAAGTLAYLVDKKISNSIHPQLPQFLGLKQAFYNLITYQQTHTMQSVLRAAAAAPPFMSPLKLDGTWAFDGGYTANAPIPAQSQSEKSGTLVLLTRHYPKLPFLFQWQGRQYWQPRQKVPVSTWDCRQRTTVIQAFLLGLHDAQGMFRYLQLLSSGQR